MMWGKSTIVLFLVLALGASSSGSAQTTKFDRYVRLDRDPGPMKFVEVRSQGQEPICVYSSLCAMWDAYRESFGEWDLKSGDDYATGFITTYHLRDGDLWEHKYAGVTQRYRDERRRQWLNTFNQLQQLVQEGQLSQQDLDAFLISPERYLQLLAKRDDTSSRATSVVSSSDARGEGLAWRVGRVDDKEYQFFFRYIRHFDDMRLPRGFTNFKLDNRYYETRDLLNAIVDFIHIDQSAGPQGERRAVFIPYYYKPLWVTVWNGSEIKREKYTIFLPYGLYLDLRKLKRGKNIIYRLLRYQAEQGSEEYANLPKPIYRSEFFVKDRDITQRLRRHFFAGPLERKMPVRLTYCARVLSDGSSYDGIINRVSFFGQELFTGRKDCGLHSSVVIGMREAGNKTEVLIQNSWGRQCRGIHGDWDCEQGKIWVDVSMLSSNTVNLGFVVPERREGQAR